MSLTRRDMLKFGAGSLAAGLFLPSISFAAFKNIPLCLQLYTVKGVSDNPAKRMADVAAMGYKGVEYAGFGGYDAKALKKFQDDAGLFCTGSHTGRNLIEDLEKLKATIEFHKGLGAKFIICPGMRNEGADGWKKAGENFAKAAEIAEKAGLYVGYHAHQHDFDIVDKEKNLSSWEVFADAGGEKVVLQIDLGHCVNKGADPFKLIEKYPGRSKTVHLKESDGKIIGEGRVDWKRAFTLLESVGGAETYTVEYEAGMDRMEASRLSAAAYYKIHG
ncbi:MAG: sugar phosphate isomerase/epimerase [Planctomycetia bacterium]|nr:sugar phosphate isomerase/epimerase [Planctomycetia bacterium]